MSDADVPLTCSTRYTPIRTSVFVGIAAHTVESIAACASRVGSAFSHGRAAGASGASAWTRAVAEGSGIGADDDGLGAPFMAATADALIEPVGVAGVVCSTPPPHATTTNSAAESAASPLFVTRLI